MPTADRCRCSQDGCTASSEPPRLRTRACPPETNSSASTILRNAASSIRPNSFSPSHVPANRNGRPSANSFAVSSEKAVDQTDRHVSGRRHDGRELGAAAGRMRTGYRRSEQLQPRCGHSSDQPRLRSDTPVGTPMTAPMMKGHSRRQSSTARSFQTE